MSEASVAAVDNRLRLSTINSIEELSEKLFFVSTPSGSAAWFRGLKKKT